MMKRRFLHVIILATLGLFTISSCGSSESKGTKAAKEVISAYNSGNQEKAKRLMEKYEDDLSGQDFNDFSNAILDYFN